MQPMRIEWQIAFWLLMLALVGFGVYLFANVLAPFIAALALGYVLDPIAGRLQKLGMSRVVAALIILAFFILLLLIFIFGVAPILGRQLVGLAESLPDYVAKLQSLFSEEAAVLMQKYGGAWLDKFGLETAPSADSIQKSLGNFVGQGVQWIGNFMKSLWSGGQALVGGSVGLHPVWLIFALLAFASLFGFAGMILAVPLAAATGVLIRFAARRYKQSALFHGVGPDAA
jgi:predicted PurR-regulated permease PerM